jgi:hypothetical protein
MAERDQGKPAIQSLKINRLDAWLSTGALAGPQFTRQLTAFHDTPYEKHVLSFSSDFESAGDSSLNYLMLTKFKPEAAQYYNKIKCRIQRACVNVFSENDWGIPFPQLSVRIPESSPKSEE